MDERRWPNIIVDDKGNTWSLRDSMLGAEIRLDREGNTAKVDRILNESQVEAVNMYGDRVVVNIDDDIVITKQYVKEKEAYRRGGADPRFSAVQRSDVMNDERLDFDFDTARLLERKKPGLILRDSEGNIIQFKEGPNARQEIEATKEMVENFDGRWERERNYEIIEAEIVEDGEGLWADVLQNDKSIIGRTYNSEKGFVSKSGDYAFSNSRMRFLGVKGGGRYNPRYGTPEYWVNRQIDKKFRNKTRMNKIANDPLAWRKTQPKGPGIAAMHGGRPYSRTWVKDGRNKVLKKPISVPGTDLKITALGMDRNGNSTVRLAPNDRRKGIAFSIQTNGNLPTLHNNKSQVLDGPGFITMKMADEIRNHVLRYGTEKQLSKGGLRRTALGGFRVMERR